MTDPLDAADVSWEPATFTGQTMIIAVTTTGGHFLVVDGVALNLESLQIGLFTVAPPDEDTEETLLDLARHDRKADFYFLAGSAGVPTEKHDELWAGARRRLGL